MLIVRKQHAKPPAGGHRFVDGPVKLTGDLPDDVIAKIESHRAANGMPLDFPEQDLAEYYQKIAPYLVREVDGERTKAQSQIEAEAVMAVWRQHPKKLVGVDAIIELRHKACAECPLRRPFVKDAESNRAYNVGARRRAELLCDNRDFKRLGCCSWTHLPVDLMCRIKDPRELAGLPPVPKICWVQEL